MESVTGGDVDTVRALVDAGNAYDYERVEALISEHFFARPSNGQIYIGPGGLRQMRDDRARYEHRTMRDVALSSPAPGFVLLRAVVEGATREGERETLPGAWLCHVRNGRVSSLVYYPTVEAALDSLPPAVRGPSARELIERVLWAFNAGAVAELTRYVTDDVRFRATPEDPIRAGIAALLEYLVEIGRTYDDYLFAPERVEELADGYVVLEGQHITRAGNVSARAERAILARSLDGLLSELIAYPDRPAADRAFAERAQ